MHFKRIFAIGTLALACSCTWGADDDRANRLWQQPGLGAQSREQSILDSEPPLVDTGKPPVLVINGRPIAVEKNAAQLGGALFLAINHRQWDDVRRFLHLYQQLPAPAEYMVLFAQAALAGSEGDMDESERLYRRLLEVKPDFVRGQIELARLLFEDYRNQESERLFGLVLFNPQVPAKVKDNLRNTFLKAIAARRAWSGYASLGMKFNSNVNQMTGSTTCLAYDPFGLGICMYERSIPDSRSSRGWSYEAALSRRFDISGQHGLLLRAMAYGDSYPGDSDYNEGALALYAGYSHNSRNGQFALLPLAEFNAVGNHAMYRAAGLKLDWSRTLAANTSANLTLESKKQFFRRDYAATYDGFSHAAYATFYYQLPSWNMVLYAGPDWLRKTSGVEMAAYEQKGVRVGAYKIFGNGGVTASLTAIARRTKYRAYNAVLGDQRKDDIRMLIASVKAPRWKVAGLTPTLAVRHTRVESTIDWLYSYRKTEVTLGFEATF